MCFLVRLGKYVLVPLLSEWLEVREFVDLNTALLIKKDRSVLMQWYAEFASSFESVFHSVCVPLSRQSIEWFTKASLTPCWVSVDGDFVSDPSLTDFLLSVKSTIGRIHSVQLRSTILHQYCLEHVLPYFTALRRLCIYSSTSLITCQSSIQLMVTSIVSTGLSSYMFNILDYFTNLVSLQMNRDIVPSAGLVIKAVVRCRHLKCLEVFLDCSDASNRRAMMMTALHAGQRFNQLLVHQADALTLKSLLWYRCGNGLHTLTVSRPVGLDKSITDTILTISPHICELRGNMLPFDTAALMRLKHLKRLSLENVKSSNDFGQLVRSGLPVVSLSALSTVKLIAEKFSAFCSVRVLNVSVSQSLDDSVVEALGKQCPMIEVLNVRSCPGISDYGFQFVLANKRLTNLNIVCTPLTGLTLKYLVEFEVPLKRIALTATMALSEDLIAFVEGCVSLRELSYNADVISGFEKRASLRIPKVVIAYSALTILS